MGLKIFLSYGHDANTDLVLRIKRDLEAAGHAPWIDSSEIEHGDDWRRRILDGLSDTDCTLAFLSRHAVREGGVCLDEIALAMGMKHGNLATILVEPEAEVQPPVSVSHIQWFDMSGWATQDDAWYQDKLHAILNLLADPETHRFRGEIEALEKLLHPITQAADIPPLIDGFVGREWVVQAVEGWRRAASQRRVFWLTGGPGAGKSAFAAWLAHYQRANVIALNLCKWNDEDRSDPRNVLRTLAFLLATRLPDYRRRLLDRFHRHDPKGEELTNKGAAAMVRWLLSEPLNLIDGGRRRDRCVLLIDALDETLRDGVSELANLLAEHVPFLPAWMGVLLTSRPEFPIAISLSHVAPLRLDAAGSARNEDDLRLYARGWLATPDRPAAAVEALIDRVVTASAGNFMYVRKLRDAVDEFRLDLNAPAWLPQGLNGLYDLWFRRQFPDRATYRTEIAPLLELLVAASRPVPVDLLRAVFGWDLPTEARLLESLGSLFEERPDGVTPFHASLRDWLIDRTRSGAAFVVDAARGSTRLATALWGRFLATPARTLPDPFTLAELPAQLGRQDSATLTAPLAEHGGFDSVVQRMDGVVDALAERVAWRAVLAWLGALDRIAELHGEAGLPWRHRALGRRADALATLGQMGQALAAHDAAVSAAEHAATAEPNDTARRNDLAVAFMNRGVTKQSAPGYGPGAAIADYDRAIGLMQALRYALGDDGPATWRNDLANAFMNRGTAKQSAPGHGPGAAIIDYDRAIELGQALREALGDDWPVPWRNNLAAAFVNRGVAKQSAPGHGPSAATADYDGAIQLMQALRDALGDDWPVPCRNDLAAALMNRGNAKRSAPGHGPGAAIADYDCAIELMQALRDALADDWPVPWRNNLAAAFMNRGIAKQDAPGHAPGAAIADYDCAIELMQALREALGDDWPAAWRNDLANALMNRGTAKQDAPGHGPGAAITDYDRAIAIRQALRDALGDGWPAAWRNDLAAAFMNRGNAKVFESGHGLGAAITDYDSAIAIRQALRDALGNDWPVPWRNDLANTFLNRGNAKRSAPGHGLGAAIDDYDCAIEIMQALRDTLRDDDWPVPWRNELAAAFMNRGIAKQDAPGHGPGAAIADYDRAIALRQALREALGDAWPAPWCNDLAGALMNRGNAKQNAPPHGPGAAITDLDHAIELMQTLRDALGDDWPVPWRNDLAVAFVNRGNAKRSVPGHRPSAAIADYNLGIALWEALERDLGSQMPPMWRDRLAAARQIRAAAQDGASDP